MKSRSFSARLTAHRHAFPVVMAAILAVSLPGCSSKTADTDAQPSTTPHNVTLSASQRPHVQIATVAAADFRKTIQTSGVVDFDNDQATSVLAPFSGPVSRLLVSPGDKVKKGQPLALVDSPDFAAAIGSYRKALLTARNARRLADADKDLVQHDGVAAREAQQAQTDAASAEADSDAALQALVAIDVDAQTIRDIQAGRPAARAYGTIRSPINGTVVEKLISPGQLLQAGTTACFTVADLSRVWVMAQVSGSELASVSIDDPAEVITGVGSQKLSGKVDNVSALVDHDTGLVAARVVVDNPGDVLKKQMYVSVQIQSSQSSRGLLVPVSAVLRDDENLPFVYTVQKDGSFARQHVTVGYRSGNKVAITDGLHAGDQVVVDGSIFVQFMQNQ